MGAGGRECNIIEGNTGAGEAQTAMGSQSSRPKSTGMGGGGSDVLSQSERRERRSRLSGLNRWGEHGLWHKGSETLKKIPIIGETALKPNAILRSFPCGDGVTTRRSRFTASASYAAAMAAMLGDRCVPER